MRKKSTVFLTILGTLLLIGTSTENAHSSAANKLKIEVINPGQKSHYDTSPFDNREDRYVNFFDDQVLPLWNSGVEGEITTKDGLQIHYRKITHVTPKPAMLILHGKAENILKYRETAFDFYHAGYNVYLYDQRGHGHSQRMTKDPHIVHVADFNDYVSDLQEFMEKVIAPDSPAYIDVFAHSMGGGAVAGYVESDLSPKFSKAVLSTPLLQVNTGVFPEFLARAISWFGVHVGLKTSYAITQGPPDVDHPDFEHTATVSRARFDRFHKDVIALHHQGIKVATAGASYSWVEESLKFTNHVTQPEAASRFKIPVLVSQVANDDWVLPGGQEKFCGSAPKCTLVRVTDAKHEIWFESDRFRAPYLARVLAFFRESRAAQ